MLSTERPQFDEHIKTLLAGYDRKPAPEKLEAYWRGLNRMPLLALERAINHALSEHDELPTPKRLWFINYELRVRPATDGGQRQNKRDKFETFSNRVLFAFLLGEGPASNESLVKLIQRKNLLAQQFRESVAPPDRDVTIDESREWREFMVNAYRELFVARTPGEVDRDTELFHHTRRMPDFSHQELQQIQEIT